MQHIHPLLSERISWIITSPTYFLLSPSTAWRHEKLRVRNVCFAKNMKFRKESLRNLHLESSYMFSTTSYNWDIIDLETRNVATTPANNKKCILNSIFIVNHFHTSTAVWKNLETKKNLPPSKPNSWYNFHDLCMVFRFSNGFLPRFPFELNRVQQHPLPLRL